MPEYRLEHGAELDLLEIGRYTVRTWSIEQAERYLGSLNHHFEAISRNDAIEKSVFEHRDDIRVSLYRPAIFDTKPRTPDRCGFGGIGAPFSRNLLATGGMRSLDTGWATSSDVGMWLIHVGVGPTD